MYYNKPMNMSDIRTLIVSILISETAGVIGGVFTASSVSGWYVTLTRPELSPPNWVFGPVWTTLYALMGIAAFLVWKRGSKRPEARKALRVFVLQLFLNTLWSIIFFGLRSPGGAFVEIIFLWCAIIWTLITFAKISRTAAWLLAPYLLWVTFAAYLNFSLWILN